MSKFILRERLKFSLHFYFFHEFILIFFQFLKIKFIIIYLIKKWVHFWDLFFKFCLNLELQIILNVFLLNV